MVPPRRPYPFQTGVATLLLQGKNVILQAPTGSGKTHAALLPFLNGLEKGRDFPRKCLYSVPMRVLAKQFVSEYQSMVTAAGRDDQLSVAIQTGEQARDPYLAQDLIFATIDQTLSSFLLAPYSLSRSRANINAAAVMSAYLVFDEFHLYDPISTLPTTLHMLQLLKGITPFLLMTATFSETMLDALAARLDAVVVPGSEAERQQMRALASQQKTRRYHIADEPLTAEAVLSTHDRRSLAICNTVDRARRLYQDLREATKKTDTQVILLHSRFQREDRDRIEDNIRACFGKDAPHRDGSFIVVATQAIEVGVDITSTRLHTELAPANAILQRAGRCARYPGEEGDVFIYRYVPGDELGETVDLIESVAPYMKQEDEFESTFAVFCDRSGHTLDFVDEQQVISAVHGKRDAEIIRQLDMDSSQHRRRLFAVMRQDEGQDARNLIREVLQQHITIHDKPDVLLKAPFDVPAFGLHPGTLQKYVKQWLERAYELELDKPIWYLKRLDGDAYEFAVQNNQPVYKWEEVKTPQAAWGAPLIVVHPALATYDPGQGFIPDVGG
ncbi:MAG: CRISPR-associated helicase Cas3', partial [Chloroflexi bacterium]|nr:CRISPR-associated helicase Cas3' [Chloroflexota bacterium]